MRSLLQPSPVEPAPATRASWYTPGLTDGLGDRLLMFDNTAASSLELLRFRRMFGDHPGFEAALRRRVDDLRHFMHPAIARVRAVDTLGEGAGLALISNYVDGKRLVDVMHDARGASFATSLIQQITPALVDLHDFGDAHGEVIAHGAICPERIVVTPEGGLVLAEHVLGSAIEALQWPSQRLRSELGIPVPPSGATTLDGRNDVMQLGFVAMSLLLGRRVDPTAYPASVSHLLDVAGAGPRGSAPSSQLRRWIERALQITDDSFESSRDALAALDEVSRARLLVAPTGPRTSAIPEDQARALHTRLRLDDSIDEMRVKRPPATLVEFPAANAEPVRDAEPAISTSTLADPPSRGSRTVIYASAAIVLAIGSFVIGQQAGRPRQTSNHAAPISEAQAPPVATIATDAATAPASTAPAAQPTVEPSAVNAPAAPAVTPIAPPKPDAGVKLAPPPATSGYLSISVPVELQIFEDGTLLGTTSSSRVTLPAGRHNLLLVNRALDFETPLPVNIPAGKSIAASVGLPNGSVSLNALPWANASLDGRPLGTTPLANLEVPIGNHEILWTHPQLGERRQTIIVPAKTPVRIVFDWSK